MVQSGGEYDRILYHTIFLFKEVKKMLSIITGTNIDEYDGIRFPENGVHPNQFKNIAREILSKAMKTNEDICVITYSAMLIEFFEVLAKYIQTVSWIDINFIVDNKDGRKKYHIDGDIVARFGSEGNV